MEIVLIGLIVLVAGAIFYFNRSAKSLDINSDGKVDTKDLSAAVTNTVEGVKATADVNKDGKVDVADVKTVADVNHDGKVNVADVEVVATKVKTTAKKAATKTKAAAATATKKPGRKPKTAK